MAPSFNIMFKLVSTPMSELFHGTMYRTFGASSLPRIDMPDSSLAAGSLAADSLFSAMAVPTDARSRHSQSNPVRYISPPSSRLMPGPHMQLSNPYFNLCVCGHPLAVNLELF